jgi:hypothetical protein
MKISAITLFAFVCAFAGCSPKGTCLYGSAHDTCVQDDKKSSCDQGSSNEFHADGPTCASLGYTVKNGTTWSKP